MILKISSVSYSTFILKLCCKSACTEIKLY